MVFKKKKVEPSISPERLAKSVPVVNPILKCEEDDKGLITIVVPVSKSGWLGKVVDIPESKKVKLDEIGSKVWKRFDGKTDVGAITEWMKKEFMITQREAEISLSLFIKKLMEKRFIALLVPPPKPGTQEALAEIERLKKELKELEKAYKSKKVDDDTYRALTERYSKVMADLQKGEPVSEGSRY
ncbi:MAG: PqqD family protein [Candidatus Bathyarchaeia archaeon]